MGKTKEAIVNKDMRKPMPVSKEKRAGGIMDTVSVACLCMRRAENKESRGLYGTVHGIYWRNRGGVWMADLADHPFQSGAETPPVRTDPQ